MPARCTHLLTVGLLHELDNGAHLCTSMKILSGPCGRHSSTCVIAQTDHLWLLGEKLSWRLPSYGTVCQPGPTGPGTSDA